MSRLTSSVAAIALAGIAASALGWEGTINGRGEHGEAHAKVWCFPNRPPNQPSFAQNNLQQHLVNLGPDLPLCRPFTQVHSQAGVRWRQVSNFQANGGDTVDWHSMLPFVTPSSTMALGSLDVMAVVNSPTSATFRVEWFGSDPGVAMHLGWFDPVTTPPTLLHEEMRIGPWSETIFITIVSNGPILNVDFESSGAA